MSTEQKTKFPTRQIWVVGLGAIAVSVFINLVVLFFATAILDIPSNFSPLQGMTVMIFTILGTFLATLVFWIINKLSRNPIRTFQIVAITALVLSILPHLFRILDPPSGQIPVSAAVIGGLFALFHILAATVCIWFFSTIIRRG